MATERLHSLESVAVFADVDVKYSGLNGSFYA